MFNNRICPTCTRREVVVDNGCAICLFLRSDEEQERLQRVVDRIFELIPEAIGYDTDRQTEMVRRALPYICTYKAQYRLELWYFIGETLKRTIEQHTIDVEEDEKVETKRWVAA